MLPFFLLLLLLLLLLSLSALSTTTAATTTLALYNKFPYPIWPGIQPSTGHSVLARGGFTLLPNSATSLRLPLAWSGRVWPRQGCSFDPKTNLGRCSIGDCGGALYCNGLGGAPPATLAEITLGGADGNDFYNVSLVDGYNVGMSMKPFRGKGKCENAGCVSDLNQRCPKGLVVVGSGNKVVACKSACSAFGLPR